MISGVGLWVGFETFFQANEIVGFGGLFFFSLFILNELRFQHVIINYKKCVNTLFVKFIF
jgi:hypothetical protein